MHISDATPAEFYEISEAELETYLKGCADYVRDAYSNCIRYRFRHSGNIFAVIVTLDGKERICIDPAVCDIALLRQITKLTNSKSSPNIPT